jgi:hypothetical protein
MSISPTQRTLKEARLRGYEVQVVERWNPHAKVRVDLFGVIDLVAITAAEQLGCEPMRILGIQACAGGSHATRRAKILAEPRAKQWIEAGGLLSIWSWAKQGARGKRKTWTLRIEAITASMFEQARVSRAA